jgi:putative redox protein
MPRVRRIEFANATGQQLAGALTLPDLPPRACVLFAHCFTCGKDSIAASRIARSLAGHRMAVLRFDFTGLGGSDGDFANTDFSSNVEDLVAAAEYLEREHEAPALLIGHSLGGTAALAAAGRIPGCRAVAVIGAPATPAHLERQFGARLDDIETSGEATVSLGGREFRIRRDFLEDLRRHDLTAQVGALRRALLILHAPLDEVVSIDEAGRIFQAARHPKSFVSLDGADHLLSNADDAQYAADTIAAWSRRYLPVRDDSRPEVGGGELWVGELDDKFLRQVASDDHAWLADEPKSVGGRNLGPDPYEHLLAALGTCTSMTVRMYANRKHWPLTDVDIRLRHRRDHGADCEGCADDGEGAIDVLSRDITLTGDLSEEQRQRLLEIADRCPVHRTLTGRIRIDTSETPPGD